MLNQSIEMYDPEIYDIIKSEEKRQESSLNLIPSENYTSIAVLQVGASVLANKYSEGEIGKRYYGGNEQIDKLEALCKKRALDLFKLDPEIWDVNVQALSGSNANLAVYLGLIGSQGKIMGLDLPSGGHLTHGYQTEKRKVSASSIFFQSKCYKTLEKNGLIDYDQLEIDAKEFKPGILIAGGSAYAFDFDYPRLRSIADAGESYLMIDMSHISGLIATGNMRNCFEYADVVTTTTHKVLRGPRSAMIFSRKQKSFRGETVNMAKQINSAVFPGLNGGPHNQKIGALAVALKQAQSDEYQDYCNQVINNATLMAEEFKKKGANVLGNKTESHLFLLSLPGLSGMEFEGICQLVNITVNRNSLPMDKSPFYPSGIRVGTPAITTRGFKEKDIINTVEFVIEASELAKKIKASTKDFKEFIKQASMDVDVLDLKKRVIEYMEKFPIPVFDFTKN